MWHRGSSRSNIRLAINAGTKMEAWTVFFVEQTFVCIGERGKLRIEIIMVLLVVKITTIFVIEIILTTTMMVPE